MLPTENAYQELFSHWRPNGLAVLFKCYILVCTFQNNANWGQTHSVTSLLFKSFTFLYISTFERLKCMYVSTLKTFNSYILKLFTMLEI